MVSVLGFGFDFRELITLMAIIFILTNIANASSQFPNSISDQIIVGVINSLFNFEETIVFNWVTEITKDIPLISFAGSTIDSIINAVLNVEIFGLRILRILGMGLVWLSAITILVPVFSSVHNYQSTMMGVPR